MDLSTAILIFIAIVVAGAIIVRRRKKPGVKVGSQAGGSKTTRRVK